MAILLKKVEGQFFENITCDVKLVSSLSGEVQKEDYINLYGTIAYLQNLSKTDETYLLRKPQNFGLKNTFNLTMTTLEISY